MNQIDQAKKEVYDYCKAMLGEGMIDIELDPIHYETALNRSLAVFRQRSDNSVEESYAFLTLIQDQNEYILPKEIQQVRQIFRRSVGSRSGGGDGGSLFEPFNLAYSNTYLLSSSNMGGLATYYAFSSYQKQVGKMFGSDINFVFNPTSKVLTIQQRGRGEEEVLVWMYNYRPDFNLLSDNYAGVWLKDYALAACKVMLGEAREKFATISSPQGGVQLNGTALKNEGKAAMDLLELDLINYKEGGTPLTWVTG
jgi:hypothetical protein